MTDTTVTPNTAIVFVTLTDVSVSEIVSSIATVLIIMVENVNILSAIVETVTIVTSTVIMVTIVICYVINFTN